MGRVAVAELEGEIFLDRYPGREFDVHSLVGDPEATGPYHAQNPVTSIEEGFFRQCLTIHHRYPQAAQAAQVGTLKLYSSTAGVMLFRK